MSPAEALADDGGTLLTADLDLLQLLADSEEAWKLLLFFDADWNKLTCTFAQTRALGDATDLMPAAPRRELRGPPSRLLASWRDTGTGSVTAPFTRPELPQKVSTHKISCTCSKPWGPQHSLSTEELGLVSSNKRVAQCTASQQSMLRKRGEAGIHDDAKALQQEKVMTRAVRSCT